MTAALLDELAGLVEAGVLAVEGRPARLDRDQYLALAAAGRFRAWVVRDEAGRPVGACGMLVMADPHTGEVGASQDALWLAPAARAGPLGAQLLRHVDRDLVEIGVVNAYRQSPTGRDIGPLLVRLGYEPVEVVYARRLAPTWPRTN